MNYPTTTSLAITSAIMNSSSSSSESSEIYLEVDESPREVFNKVKNIDEDDRLYLKEDILYVKKPSFNIAGFILTLIFGAFIGFAILMFPDDLNLSLSFKEFFLNIKTIITGLIVIGISLLIGKLSGGDVKYDGVKLEKVGNKIGITIHKNRLTSKELYKLIKNLQKDEERKE